MTGWFFWFSWHWLLVPVGLWLVRKYWLATREQPLKYLQHSVVSLQQEFRPSKDHLGLLEEWVKFFKYPILCDHKEPDSRAFGLKETTYLLDVQRRERVFPWRRHAEAWLVTKRNAIRETDGAMADGHTHARFMGMIAVAEARKLEIEELSK